VGLRRTDGSVGMIYGDGHHHTGLEHLSLNGIEANIQNLPSRTQGSWFNLCSRQRLKCAICLYFIILTHKLLCFMLRSNGLGWCKAHIYLSIRPIMQTFYKVGYENETVVE
jgi:hypothetical protein